MKHLIVALKGFFMGAANVVPGVSGGTIALITGIYKEIIEAINSLMEKQTWKSLLAGDFRGFWKQVRGTFLLPLAIGVVLSVFSLAKLMTYVLEHHPVQTWAFFFGLIVASAILMFKDIKGWGIKEILFTLAGVVLGLVVCTLSPTQTPDTWLFLFLCGAIAVCTMILPGISGSFILVILGKYDFINFQFNHCLEATQGELDVRIGIGISDNGEDWESIWEDTVYGSIAQSQYLLTFDMEEWPTKTPQFCLYFTGHGAYVSSWYIDNVIVYASKKNKYGDIEDSDENGFIASRSHVLNLKGPSAGTVTRFSTMRKSRNRYARVVEGRQKKWWQFWK